MFHPAFVYLLVSSWEILTKLSGGVWCDWQERIRCGPRYARTVVTGGLAEFCTVLTVCVLCGDVQTACQTPQQHQCAMSCQLWVTITLCRCSTRHWLRTLTWTWLVSRHSSSATQTASTRVVAAWAAAGGGGGWVLRTWVWCPAGYTRTQSGLNTQTQSGLTSQAAVERCRQQWSTTARRRRRWITMNWHRSGVLPTRHTPLPLHLQHTAAATWLTLMHCSINCSAATCSLMNSTWTTTRFLITVSQAFSRSVCVSCVSDNYTFLNHRQSSFLTFSMC